MTSDTIKQQMPPGKLIFGPGSIRNLAAELDPALTHLLMTDRGLAGCGILDRVKKILIETGVSIRVYDRVLSDPPLEVVDEAVEMCRSEGCGGVIALGGGSVIDAAKGVAVRLVSTVDLREYGQGRMVEGPIAPLYAVPTTAGTGSEVTRVAVITDSANMVKMAIRGAHLAPRAAVLDPDLLAKLPPRIAAETGADALTHAVEAFVSLRANTITDALALAAIRIIGEHLPAMVADPSNTAAVEQMLIGSCLAGQAFSNATVGLAHSLGEPLGAYFHVSHGLACSLYLPVVMAFNRPSAPEKFAVIAGALGVDTTGMDTEAASFAAVEAVKDLFTHIGLPLTFAQAGIDFKLNEKMIEDVWPQWSTKCNPRTPSADEVKTLYETPGAGY